MELLAILLLLLQIKNRLLIYKWTKVETRVNFLSKTNEEINNSESR